MKIDKMRKEHKDEIVSMMKIFYSSDAVETNGSDEIFDNDVETCIGDSPYLEGYVFSEKSEILGYAMLAKSFSTEYGKNCIWIEDIYLKPEHCGKGIGTEFFEFIEKKYPDVLFRLEVEDENERAVHTYIKNGFKRMPYVEMKK